MLTIPTFKKGKDGNLKINKTINYVRGCIMTPSSLQTPITAVARGGAGDALGLSVPVIFEAPTDAFIEIEKLAGLHTSTVADAVRQRLMVKIADDTVFRRLLMNRNVLVDHVFGQPHSFNFGDTLSSMFHSPLKLSENSDTLIMRPQQTLAMQFINGSTGGTASYTPTLEGVQYKLRSVSDPVVKKYIEKKIYRAKQVTPYWFVMDSNVAGNITTQPSEQEMPGITVPAGAQRDSTFTARADTYLILTSVMVRAIVGAGAGGDTRSVASVELFDPRAGMPFQNQPVAIGQTDGTSFVGAFGGQANFSHVLPTPIMVGPGQVIRGKFTSLVTVANVDLFVTLHGIAIYHKQSEGHFDLDGVFQETPHPLPIERIPSYAQNR